MKKYLLWMIYFFSFLFIFLLLTLFVFPIEPLNENMTYSQAVYDRNEKLLRLTLSNDDKYRLKSRLDSLPTHLIDLILLKEDRYFYYHIGVNPISLFQAFWKTYILQTRKVGASTITMQLVRLRYKLNTRDISGKLIQIFKALQIEIRYSKNEILESYLSLLPYSNNIEGIEAASLIYFKKEVMDLDFIEILTLCVIPQSPLSRTPFSENQKKLIEAKKNLFAKWKKEYKSQIDKTQFIDDILPFYSIKELPFEVPQFVYHILNHNQNKQKIVTSLDLNLQKQIHKTASNYVKRKQSLGIENCSILLVDSRDMNINSYLGSVDFFNESIDGQVDGTKAKRSPGSTLKPFIYALAMDEGLIHPKSLLRDVVMNFGPYSPENYDRQFQGPVSAEQALIRSRNIPAVALQNSLSEHSLYDFITYCNIKSRFPKNKYGLTLALGTMELSMQELVSLYGILVNGGKWSPLIYEKDHNPSWKQTDLSPESCYIVLKMLEKAKLSNQGYISDWTRDKLPVSWKTGTSIRFRDAWSIAVFGKYILAVWIGNFQGEGNPEFIGQKSASPLMFEIIQLLKNRDSNIKLKAKEKLNIREIDVCSISGDQPNPNCPHTTKTLFIPGKSPIKICKIHQLYLVNSKTGKRPCKGDDTNVKSEVFEVWPGELLEIFKKAGLKRKTPPDFDQNCEKQLEKHSGFPPKIIYPNKASVIVFDWNKKNNAVPLKGLCDSQSNNLYWFANGAYIAKTGSGEVYMWKGKPGKYTLHVIDNIGRWDQRKISIKIN